MTEKNKKKKGLGWKDYMALIIAMLTTTLLATVTFARIGKRKFLIQNLKKRLL